MDGQSTEVVEARDEYSSTFTNPDGSRTAVMSTQPVHYQRPDGGWAAIDNHVIRSEAGVLQSAANVWTVSFRGLASEGVSLTLPEGSLRWLGANAADVEPVVEPDGTSVRYVEAWPDVDVVYRVTELGVEEIVYLKTPQASSVVRFEFPEADVAARGDGVFDVGGPLAGLVQIDPVVVHDATGEDVTVDAGATVADAGIPPDAEIAAALEVSVDAEWLANQPVDSFPVAIDPTTSLIGTSNKIWGVERDGTVYPADQASWLGGAWYALHGNNPNCCVPVRDQFFRAIAEFDYTSVHGYRVGGVELQVQQAVGGSDDAPLLAHWTNSSSIGYHHPTQSGVVPRVVPEGGGCVGAPAHTNQFEGSSTPSTWTNLLPATAQFGGGDQGEVRTFTNPPALIELFDYLANCSVPKEQGRLLFRTSETPGEDTQNGLIAKISITYGRHPTVPNIGHADNPLDNGRVLRAMPYLRLASASTDADGNALEYRVEMGADDEIAGSRVVVGDWISYATTSPSGAIPVPQEQLGQLEPGEQYWWRIVVTDGMFTVSSAPRGVLWDPDPAEAASETIGPFNLKIATGTIRTGVATPAFQSVSGAVGASLDYESLPRRYGLNWQVWRDTDHDAQMDSNEPVEINRPDAIIDEDWGLSGPTPALTDWFGSRWTGFITPPTGTWYVLVECDQSIRWAVGSVSGSWTCGGGTGNIATLNGGQTYSFDLTVIETTGNATAALYVMRASDFYTQLAPPSWFTTSRTVLPAGWSFSAGDTSILFNRVTRDADTLVLHSPAGDAVTWHRTVGTGSSTAWAAPAGNPGIATQDAVGTVTVVAADGLTYVFNADGNIREAVDSVDERNRSAAPRHAYDQSGRPTKVTDPVTGRQLRFAYQGQTGCSSPTVPNGFLCAILFAKSDADTSPETWTTIGYSSSSAGAVITSITNRGGETTSFGWVSGTTGSLLSAMRLPAANDAVAAGVRTDTQPVDQTVWTVSYGTVHDTLNYPVQFTAPAPLPAAARPQSTFTPTWNKQRVAASSVSASVAGTSPIAGYYSTADLDEIGRATLSRDSAGRASTVTYNVDGNVTETFTAQGQRQRRLYDQYTRMPVESWGPASANDTCWMALSSSNPNCNDVPRVTTEYDLDSNGQPLQSLQGIWWASADYGQTTDRPALNTLGVTNGSPSIDVNWGTAGPSGLLNSSGVTVVDSFSGHLSGQIQFPVAGTYTLRIVSGADETVSMWVGLNQLLTNVAGGGSATFDNSAPGAWQPITILYKELAGPASLALRWTPPGGAEVVVPGTQLRPNYLRAARQRSYDDAGNVEEQSLVVVKPEYGSPTSVVTGTGSSAATASDTFEPAGTGWQRALTHTLPAGNTWSSTFYGDTQGLAATICGVLNGTVQSGLQRQRLGPDPDGTGLGKRHIEEFVYDLYGTARGQRAGYEGAVAGELDASVPWQCVASVDARYRPTQVLYPAHGYAPARTVHYDYAKNGNPLVIETCDHDLPGSPVAGGTGVCAGKNGVTTVTSDLLGRAVAATDVWGKTTTSTYNQAGLLISSVGPHGTETFGHNADGQPTTYSIDGTVVATQAYSATTGMLSTVTYSNGTMLTDLSGAGKRFPDGTVRELTYAGPGGTIVSHTITSRRRDGRTLGETLSDGSTSRAFTYSYDGAGRLRRATSPLHIFDYQYHSTSACPNPDAGRNSNRTTVVDTNISTGAQWMTVSCYDKADRLTSYGNPSTYSSRVIADSPVGYWRLDDSSSTATDSSGNNRHGTYSGALLQGQLGAPTGETHRAVRSAPPTNVGRVAINDDAFNLSGNLTVEAWVRPSAVTGDWQVVASRCAAVVTNCSTGRTFELVLDPQGRPALHQTGSAGISSVTGPDSLSLNRWTHLTATRTGSTLRLYVDGIEVAQAAFAGSIPSLPGQPVNIGQRYVGSTALHPFSGDLDDVAIYSVALSQSQIAAHVSPAPASAVVQPTYDSRGNTVQDYIGAASLQTYYDGTGRNTGYTRSQGTALQSTRFSYDVAGKAVLHSTEDLDNWTQRLITKGPGWTALFDAQIAGNPRTERTFFLPGGVVLTRSETAGDTWSYPDLRGNVVARTNSAGLRIGGLATYSPFGQQIEGLTPANGERWTHGWLGQHDRPTDKSVQFLQPMGARTYDQSKGRFLEVDPIEGGCANSYAYGFGDPISQTDLSGQSACRATYFDDWHLWLPVAGAWKNGRAKFTLLDNRGGQSASFSGLDDFRITVTPAYPGFWDLVVRAPAATTGREYRRYNLDFSGTKIVSFKGYNYTVAPNTEMRLPFEVSLAWDGNMIGITGSPMDVLGSVIPPIFWLSVEVFYTLCKLMGPPQPGQPQSYWTHGGSWGP